MVLTLNNRALSLNQNIYPLKYTTVRGKAENIFSVHMNIGLVSRVIKDTLTTSETRHVQQLSHDFLADGG